MKKKDLYYERIPTKLQREDVKYLGNMLGKVILNQEGRRFFNLVEKIRKLSKANKVNPNQKKLNIKVINAIKKINPQNTFKLTRAFSHFMNLINLAELVDASRILNDYENNKKKLNNQSIFIEEIFEDLFNKKYISKNTIYNLTKDLDIGIVLTAHPTEVKRRTSIQKYHKIIEILEQRELFKNFPSKLKVLDK